MRNFWPRTLKVGESGHTTVEFLDFSLAHSWGKMGVCHGALLYKEMNNQESSHGKSTLELVRTKHKQELFVCLDCLTYQVDKSCCTYPCSKVFHGVLAILLLLLDISM